MSGWSNVICNAHSGIVLQAKCDPKAGRARADAFFKGQIAISQFVMVVAPDDGLTALCIDPNDNTIHQNTITRFKGFSLRSSDALHPGEVGRDIPLCNTLTFMMVAHIGLWLNFVTLVF